MVDGYEKIRFELESEREALEVEINKKVARLADLDEIKEVQRNLKKRRYMLDRKESALGNSYDELKHQEA